LSTISVSLDWSISSAEPAVSVRRLPSTRLPLDSMPFVPVVVAET
jgi:hypothetical protein